MCHIWIDILAGGIDYSQWREKAQNLFSDEKEPLSVTGTKTGIKSDETRTFWSTAPPKVDHDKAWGQQCAKCLFYAHCCVGDDSAQNAIR